MVEGGGWGGKGVRGGEVELFAPVGAKAGYFVAEFIVACVVRCMVVLDMGGCWMSRGGGVRGVMGGVGGS